jgi:hypothetical protein
VFSKFSKSIFKLKADLQFYKGRNVKKQGKIIRGRILIWEKIYAFVAYVSVQGERLKKELRERVMKKVLLSLNLV